MFSKHKKHVDLPKIEEISTGKPNYLFGPGFLHQKIQSAKEPEQDHHGQGLGILQQWGEIFPAGDAQLRWHQVIPGKMTETAAEMAVGALGPIS